MANSYSSRTIRENIFDGKGYTNEQSLSNALLTKPDVINPIMTHLSGPDAKKFPLTFLTEGQSGGMIRKELQDIQYEWNTFNRMRMSDAVVASGYTSVSKPGLGNTPIYTTMETDWIKKGHLIVSPNGYICRVAAVPTPTGNGNFLYKLYQNAATSATSYVPYTEFLGGVRWSMEGGAPVSESYSMGNASNKVMPGKMKNQMSILRKSYEWGGNVANRSVEITFTMDGKKSNLYMSFERWQHTMDWKQAVEESLWRSVYNRRTDGSIADIDEDSNLPIPQGAGLLDQIPNEDTYGVLTARKLKNTVGDIFYGMTDTLAMDVVLYTGLGGAEEFDTAMKTEASGFTYMTAGSDKFITGAGRNLRLGGFFAQYEHVDGHVITVKLLPMLDYGARAENARKHPISGKPICSYDMYFVDQSTYDGVRNIQMVTQKGRSMITGIVKGMSPLPAMDFAGNNSDFISTEQDKCSMHMLSVVGVCLNRPTTSFKLTCELV